MLLRRHNLNLLPILRELLRTRSVGQTARTIGLSQSAVSAALARLRHAHGDELLVMVGRRLELTEKAIQLIEPTERACREIESLLRPRDFDPSVETRRFIVATADYVAFLMGPPIARLFEAEAPHASIQFIDTPLDINSQLARGAVDLVAIPSEMAGVLLDSTQAAPLFEDRFVVIAAASHPAVAEGLTREAYERSRHVRFKPVDRHANSYQDVRLQGQDIIEMDQVLVQQFVSLPAIVESSNLLALIQRRLAERFIRSHEIRILEPPFELPKFSVTAFWPRAVTHDPAHAWFRGLMARAGASLDLAGGP